MSSISKRVAKLLERQLIEGVVYRVDLDRVDVAPAGSAGLLRSLPLTGDREKVKAGDRVRVVTVAGERVALLEDVALEEGGGEEVQDASSIVLEERLSILPAVSSGASSQAANLGDLADVDLISDPPEDGQALAFDAALAKWVPRDMAAGAGDWVIQGSAQYDSPTSVVILGASVIDKFPKGTRVRVIQSGASKYFYVISATYAAGVNTINLTGGSDYTVANAAISELAYSHMQTPQGFPEWFDYPPVWSVVSGTQPNLGNGVCRGQFKLDGSLLTMSLFLDTGSTSTYGSGNYQWSLPVPVWSGDGSTWTYYGSGVIRDQSTNTRYPITVQLNNGFTTAWVFSLTNTAGTGSTLTPTVPMAWATSDELYFSISYRI